MAVAATGFFDGVHLGHLKVVSTLLDLSSERGEQGRIITFWPHPRTLFQQDARDFRLLSSKVERDLLLRQAGVGDIVLMEFDRSLASKTAGEYLEILKSQGVDAIVLGYDNRFGSDGLSTMEIAELAGKMGIRSVVCTPYEVLGAPVSSTRIRHCLEEGRVEDACAMLGRAYSVSGVVVGGFRKGRTIGFPTANIKLREPLKCIPKTGVYFGFASVCGEQVPAMINVDGKQTIEAHLIDFSKDIYGMDITVDFRQKLRDEMAFESLQQLKGQLEKDLVKALLFLTKDNLHL